MEKRIYCAFILHHIGADSMEAMGRSPHGQKVMGAMPQSRPHGNFVVIFFKQQK